MSSLRRAALLGLGWGLLAAVLLPIYFGGPPLISRAISLLLGAPMGVLFGIAVYRSSRRIYRHCSKLGLACWSVVSLYVAAALWGVWSMAARELAAGPLEGWGGFWAQLLGGAIVACYGLTASWSVGPLLFLLAASSHYWLMTKEPQSP